jgi:hypothetical protein
MLTMVMGRSRPGGSYCDIFLWILLTTLSACHHHARVQATKRLRAALKEKDVINAELRRATQAKSDFLANMSHGTLRYIPYIPRIPQLLAPTDQLCGFV